jgi:hypothetical protein
VSILVPGQRIGNMFTTDKSVSLRALVARIQRKLAAKEYPEHLSKYRDEYMLVDTYRNYCLDESVNLIELGQPLGCLAAGMWVLGDGPSAEHQGTHFHMLSPVKL